MDKKVSVIIPNYNAEEYIESCINSVLNQSYKNIEIIIIDDGSTDNSWEIISDFKKKHINIITLKQANMNASIARNKGIEIASGEYVLFLDSDDELFNISIEILVTNMEKSNSHLGMGNFISIDSSGKELKKYNIVDSNKVVENLYDYIGVVPNPSNKMFRMDIIKKNNINFGNVRIGQDLNFFLKYISCCEKIQLVNSEIYKWRILQSSMSNSYNFRIFDITESFKDIKQFYSINKKLNLYNEYIKMIEYRHYYLQMEKQKNFTNKKARKLVVCFFELKLKELDVIKCINFEKYYSDYKKSKIKMKLKFLYTTKLYFIIDNKFARKNNYLKR